MTGDTNFKRIMAGLNDVVAIMRGDADPATYRVHVPEEVDVRAIRKRQGRTQVEFAARYGFTVGAVRDWEQGRRRPEASARVLLTVIAHAPEAVERALGGVGEPLI